MGRGSTSQLFTAHKPNCALTKKCPTHPTNLTVAVLTRPQMSSPCPKSLATKLNCTKSQPNLKHVSISFDLLVPSSRKKVRKKERLNVVPIDLDSGKVKKSVTKLDQKRRCLSPPQSQSTPPLVSSTRLINHNPSAPLSLEKGWCVTTEPGRSPPQGLPPTSGGGPPHWAEIRRGPAMILRCTSCS